MILNNAPQAEAVLSNVGEIGEFRIRNSAKAFNILSSGLYANKIKAIIRELSCNAIDSHTAAGTDKPFQVHIPTQLEPWFSIRDFGTGLNHEQVSNIYTTYFESTKTESNAFIGALGLGSKSPFSYTDNFTVTAIKDGHKGIYSAFINDQGVPSIALMSEEDTTEPNGVEVKFSVNDRYDFHKFEEEARSVYKWFNVQPEITGASVIVSKMTYDSENIIPGVHSSEQLRRSMAVMGNIAYPIEVPQAENSLEGLHKLLNCGLVMEFGIGELDFQASREGLSYIPLTVDSIRNKLKQLNNSLTDVLAKEANEIDCAWSRSQFLNKRKRSDLWQSSVVQYVNNTGFNLCDAQDRYSGEYSIQIPSSAFADLNICIRSFYAETNRPCRTNKPTTIYVNGTAGRQAVEHWTVPVSDRTHFVVNDLKVGATERAKYHYRKSTITRWHDVVFVLEKIDKTKPMKLDEFFQMMENPPMAQRLMASSLDEKPRAASKGIGRNVTILQLEERGGNRSHSASHDFVWRAGGTLDQFDDKKTYYYIPLKGFAVQWDKLTANFSVSELYSLLKRTQVAEFNVPVYGVRKTDIEAIKKKKNWKPFDGHIYDTLTNLTTKIGMAMVMERLDRQAIFDYNIQELCDGIVLQNSPAKVSLQNFAGLPKMSGISWLRMLMSRLKMEPTVNVDALVDDYKGKLRNLHNRYPLVSK
jgi:hypothetical protein